MSTTTNGLVENLRASRLLTDEQLEALTASAGDDPARIITSLNQSRWITPWQLRVVESGASGPFQLGDYLLLDRLEQGPVAGCFVARHLPSSHPVLLQFVAGDGAEAERLWPLVERSATRLAPVRHPGLLEVFAAVELPEFAFVATELPAGKSLGELLPAGRKTKSAQAAMIVAQVARAVQACHTAGIVHGQIGMDSVWLASKNLARLRLNPLPWNAPLPEWLPPEQRAGGAASVAGDVWQVGCLFCRLVTGKLPTEAPAAGESDEAEGIARQLAQEKVPAELQELATSLLARDPARRMGNLDTAAAAFASAAGDAGVPADIEPADSLIQLRRFAERDRAAGNGPVIVGKAIDSPLELSWGDPGRKAAGRSVMVKPGLDRVGQTRSAGRWWPWAAMALSLGLVATAVVIFRPDNRQVATRNGSAEPATNTGDETGQTVPVNEAGTTDEAASGDVNPANSSTSTTGSGDGSRQAVVPDDGSMLWESPTSGPVLDASGLPPAPRMVFSLRCRELAGQLEFQRLLAQPGSGPAALAAELESVTGLQLVEVAQLLVGVYPSQDPAKYQLFLVARLPEAVNRETLVAALSLNAIADSTPPTEAGATEAVAEPGSELQEPVGEPPDTLFERSGRRVALLNRRGAAGESVDTVCVGSSELMDMALANGANVVADGTFGRLAAISDNERLVTALVVPAALFNDAGQAMTTGNWAPVFERFAAIADDSLRAVMISVDLNRGCFVEAVLDHSVDLRPDAALDKLRADLRGLRASAADGLAATPGHPWWEKVRLQLTGMFHLLSRQTRTGIENDLVVANCWLPEVALHNLVGGGELALGGMRGAGGTGVAAVTEPAMAGPQTIEDLLRLPRSLEVTTNPDLGVLLQGIEDEVNSEHGGLGFRFRIRLEGPDLLKQGITQNQRPGNFSISDQLLADMLTEIMFRANPNKTASGPNDPLCELVWVVAPDPEQPGQKMVQVTTRTASEEKMLELPPAFRLE